MGSLETYTHVIPMPGLQIIHLFILVLVFVLLLLLFLFPVPWLFHDVLRKKIIKDDKDKIR